MKYLKTYEDYKLPGQLLCIYSDHDNFTSGNIYTVVHNPSIMINDQFPLKIIDNNGEAIYLDMFIPDKNIDELINMYETLIFTRDKSMEEYKLRKQAERYNI